MSVYSLISWGANSHGQLGHGIKSEECVFPREVDLSNSSLKPENVKKIVGGAGHTLILDEQGHVYSCGWNNKGQAGFPVKEDTLFFRELNGKFQGKVVVDVECGWDCSAALTIDGVLYLWGSNNFGQLGRNPTETQWTYEPFEVAIDRRIKGISMGLRHTALITGDFKVLITGAGNKGQLGLGCAENQEGLNATFTFTEVSTLTHIDDVSCGQQHTILKSRNGELYAFGENKHGQLGLNWNIFQRIDSPTKLDDLNLKLPIKMYSGWSHVIILSDRQVFGWGRNTYGQLGIMGDRSTWNLKKVTNLTNVRDVSVGSEHNIALTENGKILCWGWNEHGNCGNGLTTDVKQPQEILLPYNYTGIIIGSGAGHSFAVIKKN